MARLYAANGVPVNVADDRVENLLGRGFRRADEATPETEAPAEPEATTDEGQGDSDPDPEPEAEAPVKRGPGRPRKS